MSACRRNLCSQARAAGVELVDRPGRRKAAEQCLISLKFIKAQSGIAALLFTVRNVLFKMAWLVVVVTAGLTGCTLPLWQPEVFDPPPVPDRAQLDMLPASLLPAK